MRGTRDWERDHKPHWMEKLKEGDESYKVAPTTFSKQWNKTKISPQFLNKIYQDQYSWQSKWYYESILPKKEKLIKNPKEMEQFLGPYLWNQSKIRGEIMSKM